MKKGKFDPNLREAMSEIRAICKRRNIAAHVLLASENWYEFGLLFDIPDWSAITLEKADKGLALRVKAKKADPNYKRKTDATVGMIYTFQDMMANSFEVLDVLKKKLREHMTILHLNRVGVEPDSVPDTVE